MQSKRDGLIPIGDAFSGMGGPVKAIREATPQARHHFTLADQVNQLVTPHHKELWGGQPNYHHWVRSTLARLGHRGAIRRVGRRRYVSN